MGGCVGGMTSLMLDLILNKFFCSNKNGCCFCLKVSVVWVEMVTYSGKTTRKPSSSLFVTARMEKGSTSAWLTGRVPAVKIHRFSWFFFTLCGDPFRRGYTTVYSYVGRNSIKSNYWCWMLKSGYKLTPCGWICQVRLTYFSTAPLEAVGVSAKYFSGRRLFHLVAFFVCYFLLSPLTILTTKNAVHLRTSVLQAKRHHHKVFVSNCFSMYVRIFIEVLQATLTNRHFHAYLASQSNFSVSFFLSLSLSVHLSLPPPLLLLVYLIW